MTTVKHGYVVDGYKYDIKRSDAGSYYAEALVGQAPNASSTYMCNKAIETWEDDGSPMDTLKNTQAERERIVSVRYVYEGVVYSIRQQTGTRGHLYDYTAKVESGAIPKHPDALPMLTKRRVIEAWLEDGKPYDVR